jgi:hypothetical protein
MAKKVEKICKNCKLYDRANNECSIIILHEGQKLKLPVLPQDTCFFEGQYFDPTTKAMEDFTGSVDQVKFWVEDKEGKKTDGNGTVKIEYPEGLLDNNIDKLFS